MPVGRQSSLRVGNLLLWQGVNVGFTVHTLLALECRQRVDVIFNRPEGLFGEFICLDKLRTKLLSLGWSLGQRFPGGDGIWEWPGDYR